MDKLARAKEVWLKLLKENIKKIDPLSLRQWQLDNNFHLKEKPLCQALMPIFIDQETINIHQKVNKTIYLALLSTIEYFSKNPNEAKFYAKDSIKRSFDVFGEIVQLNPRKHLLVSRFDGNNLSSSNQFMELNCGMPGGHSHTEIAAKFYANPAIF